MLALHKIIKILHFSFAQIDIPVYVFLEISTGINFVLFFKFECWKINILIDLYSLTKVLYEYDMNLGSLLYFLMIITLFNFPFLVEIFHLECFIYFTWVHQNIFLKVCIESLSVDKVSVLESHLSGLDSQQQITFNICKNLNSRQGKDLKKIVSTYLS